MDKSPVGFVNTKQAAALTGYTKDYVGQLARDGYIESKKVGRARYVKVSDLFSYVQAKTAASESSANSGTNSSVKTSVTPPVAATADVAQTPENQPINKIEINTFVENEEVDNTETEENEGVSKKIVSPWMKNKPVADDPGSAFPVEYSALNPRSKGSNLPIKRPSILPMVLPAATMVAVIFFMVIVGSMINERAQYSLANDINVANVQSLDLFDQIAIGWHSIVNDFIN